MEDTFFEAMQKHCVGKPVKIKSKAAGVTSGFECRLMANRKMTPEEANTALAKGTWVRSWREEAHDPSRHDLAPNVPTGNRWWIVIHEDDVVGVEYRQAESRSSGRPGRERFHDVYDAVIEWLPQMIAFFVLLPAGFIVAEPPVAAVPLSIGGFIMLVGWLCGFAIAPDTFWWCTAAGYVIYSGIIGLACTHVACAWVAGAEDEG